MWEYFDERYDREDHRARFIFRETRDHALDVHAQLLAKNCNIYLQEYMFSAIQSMVITKKLKLNHPVMMRTHECRVHLCVGEKRPIYSTAWILDANLPLNRLLDTHGAWTK